MTYDALHRPLYTAEVLCNSLNLGGDRPLLHQLDGPTLTVGDMRDETSRYVQALESVGVTVERGRVHARSAVLSQARARRRSRSTVPSDTSSAAATSGRLRPPK